MSIADARKTARAWAGEVARGIDPASMRDQRRAEAAAQLSAEKLADAGERFFHSQRAHLKPGTVRDYRAWWAKHVIPSLGHRTVSSISQKDIRQLHVAMSETPTSANRVVAVLGSFFSWAAGEGLIPRAENPARVSKKGGAHGIRMFEERRRTRDLAPDEYRRLGGALERAENEGLSAASNRRRPPVTGPTAKHRPSSALLPVKANEFAIHAIRLLALTGWRESEVLGLSWAQLEPRRPTVTLLDTKTGKSERPIGEAVRSYLGMIRRIDGSPWVLPGLDPHRPLREINRVWYAARESAGGLAGVATVENVTLHTLRHSFATVGKDLGYSDDVIGVLLGHSRRGRSTTAIYAHVRPAVAQRAADAISAEIAAQLGLAIDASASSSDDAAVGTPLRLVRV